LRGKVFLREILGLTGMEASLTLIPAGESVPFLHKHRTHEELWVITDGHGQMQVDGQTFDVTEGTVVRVAPPGARAIRAAADSPLGFICIQTCESSMPADEAKRDGLPVDGALTWPG
jgi:mannose-6-phosphate isomerase-like protein (cupin superfamily)